MQTTHVSAHEIARRVEEARNLVPMFAWRYRSRGVAFEDLVGAGNVGVIEAAHRFDPNRGVKFGSYAGWWIRKAIVESLHAGVSMVAVPRSVARRRQQVMAAMKRDRSSGKRRPQPERRRRRAGSVGPTGGAGRGVLDECRLDALSRHRRDRT